MYLGLFHLIMSQYFSTPKYVTIDLFGKVGCGKTTIFEKFAGNRFLKDGGNLSYDFRGYYAKCWILPQRWEHTMIFLADPKLEFRWRDLQAKHLRKLFEPTNILILVTDSTSEDVQGIKQSFSVWPSIKKKMIIFVIANMQDLPNRLSEIEIKQELQMNDVMGISALTDTNITKIEAFFEEAVIRYFTMLSKRGQTLLLLEKDEIGFGNKIKSKEKGKGKYSERIAEIRSKRTNPNYEKK